MPSRNTLKQFIADSSYHCYNRGVNKMPIFIDEQDHGVFLNRLMRILSDPEDIRDEHRERGRIKSFYKRVELRSYCLMPNHFHLLLYQHDDTAISEFMRTLGTSYTMYFNNRYERVGHLFQGRYKARLITSDDDAIHISRYIHLNPLHHPDGYEVFPYSSMQYIIFPERKPSWVAVEKVLDDHNGSRKAYRTFVAAFATEEKLDNLKYRYHGM